PVFGGHKGLGVSLLVELLVGCLATGHGSSAIKKQRRYPGEPMGCGQLFLGFSPAAFAGADPADVVRELQEEVAGAYAEPPARPWFPEQMEEDATAQVEREGIEIAPDLAALLGVDEGAIACSSRRRRSTRSEPASWFRSRSSTSRSTGGCRCSASASGSRSPGR